MDCLNKGIYKADVYQWLAGGSHSLDPTAPKLSKETHNLRLLDPTAPKLSKETHNPRTYS